MSQDTTVADDKDDVDIYKNDDEMTEEQLAEIEMMKQMGLPVSFFEKGKTVKVKLPFYLTVHTVKWEILQYMYFYFCKCLRHALLMDLPLKAPKMRVFEFINGIGPAEETPN